jgi:hypothetical protein
MLESGSGGRIAYLTGDRTSEDDRQGINSRARNQSS